MRIAVDAMGGDHAPAAPVRGALDALAAEPGLAVALVGRPEVLQPLLAGVAAEVRERLEVVPASEVIGPEEAPAAAFARKRDSSIAVGLNLCKRGEADALVSAGNTGALMAGSLLTWGRIAGVDRPAMPVVLPTVDARGCVLLDIGAHMDADARNLYDYGVMGSLYAQRVRGVEQPRVGLLNVGTEPRKGPGVMREAYALLAKSGLNFAGNVEGRDLFRGDFHVVVTDGFVGNVVIKAIEGVGQGVSQVMGYELRHSGLLTLLGAALAARTLRGLRKRLDYAEYGGVPFLGVNGVCVKCHGSSDVRAMKNGVLAAARVVDRGVIPSIAAALAAGAAVPDGGPLDAKMQPPSERGRIDA
jgi:glycerol-3-phosphate acyltransferase PlsX